MMNILTPHFEPTDSGSSSQYFKTASAAVKKILQSKPGGLSGLEASLDQYVTAPPELLDFRSHHSQYVVIGIGGSSLGVQVLAEVSGVRNFHFIENVDAVQIETLLTELTDLNSVGWLVISKSGRTSETLAALDFAAAHLRERGTEIAQHTVVITEKKESDLYNWSQRHKTLFYEVPLNVGGRFSVLSAVGLVPAILMNLEVRELRRGALAAYGSAEQLTRVTSASLASFAREEWITVLWSYSSRLKFFGLWWQQLWAESLAKKVNLQGAPAPRVSTPVPLVGATDQHSALQQIMEGARDKLVIFLRSADAEGGTWILQKPELAETALLAGRPLGALLQAEAEAIQQALSEVGVPNLSLKVEDLRAANIGYLFMFFQLLVIAIGEAHGIDTFNQPGVELGKIKTKEILRQAAVKA